MSSLRAVVLSGTRLTGDPNDDANLLASGGDGIQHTVVTEQNSSTGLLQGGILTVGSVVTNDTIVVNLEPGSGIIMQYGPPMGVRSQKKMTWSNTEIPVTIAEPNVFMYISMNNTGIIQLSTLEPTNSQKRDLIYFGYVEKSTPVSSLPPEFNVVSKPVYVSDISSVVHDIMGADGLINESGNTLTGNNNLSFNSAPGVIFGAGINYAINEKDPNEKSLPLFDSSVSGFKYVYQNGKTSDSVYTVDPLNINTSGAILTELDPNRWSIQRVYVDTVPNYYLQYGEVQYDTKAEALEGINDLVTTPQLLVHKLLLGYIVMKEKVTLLDGNSGDYEFRNIVKGNLVAGPVNSNVPTYVVARLGTGTPGDSIIIESSPKFPGSLSPTVAKVNGSPTDGTITSYTLPNVATLANATGLVVGQTIYIAGSTSNDGEYTIDLINGNDVHIKEMGLSDTQAMNGYVTNCEQPVDGSITAIVASTMLSSGTIAVVDAAGIDTSLPLIVTGTAANNGTYTITSVDGLTDTITVSESTVTQVAGGGQATQESKTSDISLFNSATQLTLADSTSLVAGDTIVVSGETAPGYNGVYEVATSTTNGTVITIVQSPSFNIAGPGGTVANSGDAPDDGTISSYPSSVEVIVANASGIVAEDVITITGSTSNNGTYTVKNVVFGSDRFQGTAVGDAFNQANTILWNYVTHQSGWGIVEGTIESPDGVFTIPKAGLYQINYEFNWTTTLDVLERINIYIKKNAVPTQYGDNIIATTVDAQSARTTGSAAIYFDQGDAFEIVFKILSATGLITNVALGAVVGSAIAPGLLDPTVLPLIYGISGGVPILGDSAVSPLLNLVTNEALNIGGTGPNGETYEPAGREGGASSNSGAGYRGTPRDLYMEVSAHYVN